MDKWKATFRAILAEAVAAICIGSIAAVTVALAIKFITWLF